MIRTLTLSLPPSTNHLYPSLPNGRRVKSKAAGAYQEEVAYAILEQWGVRRWQGHGVWEPYDGRLAVGWVIVADYRRDIDNMYKIVLDGCTRAGVYRDDRQIDAQIVRRRKPHGSEHYLCLLFGTLAEEGVITAQVQSGARTFPAVLDTAAYVTP